MATAAVASPVRAAEKAATPLAGAAGTVGLSANANAKAGAARETEDEIRWKPVLDLPCELVVDLPLPGFKIADLLHLRPGAVIDAHWRLGQDVPLRLNGTLIGWVEFEGAGESLAVRMTELA
jgi:flagellar motor switch/type III secretory pathway protein FliN